MGKRRRVEVAVTGRAPIPPMFKVERGCHLARVPHAHGGAPVRSRRRPTAPGSGLSPRVRGGAMMECVQCDSSQGLSPRVRGEPRRLHLSPEASGVYPRVCGGAGFTESVSVALKGLSPRVRGEPGSLWRSGPAAGGLSPRVRGSRHELRPSAVWARSIPACAGGAAPALVPTVEAPGLSPRVRGEPP